jgi:hypothetical protein
LETEKDGIFAVAVYRRNSVCQEFTGENEQEVFDEAYAYLVMNYDDLKEEEIIS